MNYYTLKIEKICFSPKVSIQPYRPKSDSALPGAIWAQFRPKKLYQKAIPAHSRAHFSPGTKSALSKGAKLDPKIGLYFTHRNGPIFRAKTNLSDLECIGAICIYVFSCAYTIEKYALWIFLSFCIEIFVNKYDMLCS